MLAQQPEVADGGPASLVSYASVEDWLTLPDREPVLWKPHCSVIAELRASFPAQIVVLDVPVYTTWLAGREDNETMRSYWAAEV